MPISITCTIAPPYRCQEGKIKRRHPLAFTFFLLLMCTLLFVLPVVSQCAFWHHKKPPGGHEDTTTTTTRASTATTTVVVAAEDSLTHEKDTEMNIPPFTSILDFDARQGSGTSRIRDSAIFVSRGPNDASEMHAYHDAIEEQERGDPASLTISSPVTSPSESSPDMDTAGGGFASTSSTPTSDGGPMPGAESATTLAAEKDPPLYSYYPTLRETLRGLLWQSRGLSPTEGTPLLRVHARHRGNSDDDSSSSSSSADDSAKKCCCTTATAGASDSRDEFQAVLPLPEGEGTPRAAADDELDNANASTATSFSATAGGAPTTTTTISNESGGDEEEEGADAMDSDPSMHWLRCLHLVSIYRIEALVRRFHHEDDDNLLIAVVYAPHLFPKYNYAQLFELLVRLAYALDQEGVLDKSAKPVFGSNVSSATAYMGSASDAHDDGDDDADKCNTTASYEDDGDGVTPANRTQTGVERRKKERSDRREAPLSGKCRDRMCFATPYTPTLTERQRELFRKEKVRVAIIDGFYPRRNYTVGSLANTHKTIASIARELGIDKRRRREGQKEDADDDDGDGNGGGGATEEYRQYYRHFHGAAVRHGNGEAPLQGARRDASAMLSKVEGGKERTSRAHAASFSPSFFSSFFSSSGNSGSTNEYDDFATEWEALLSVLAQDFGGSLDKLLSREGYEHEVGKEAGSAGAVQTGLDPRLILWRHLIDSTPNIHSPEELLGVVLNMYVRIRSRERSLAEKFFSFSQTLKYRLHENVTAERKEGFSSEFLCDIHYRPFTPDDPVFPGSTAHSARPLCTRQDGDSPLTCAATRRPESGALLSSTTIPGGGGRQCKEDGVEGDYGDDGDYEEGGTVAGDDASDLAFDDRVPTGAVWFYRRQIRYFDYASRKRDAAAAARRAHASCSPSFKEEEGLGKGNDVDCTLGHAEGVDGLPMCPAATVSYPSSSATSAAPAGSNTASGGGNRKKHKRKHESVEHAFHAAARKAHLLRQNPPILIFPRLQGSRPFFFPQTLLRLVHPHFPSDEDQVDTEESSNRQSGDNLWLRSRPYRRYYRQPPDVWTTAQGVTEEDFTCVRENLDDCPDGSFYGDFINSSECHKSLTIRCSLPCLAARHNATLKKSIEDSEATLPWQLAHTPWTRRDNPFTRAAVEFMGYEGVIEGPKEVAGVMGVLLEQATRTTQPGELELRREREELYLFEKALWEVNRRRNAADESELLHGVLSRVPATHPFRSFGSTSSSPSLSSSFSDSPTEVESTSRPYDLCQGDASFLSLSSSAKTAEPGLASAAPRTRRSALSELLLQSDPQDTVPNDFFFEHDGGIRLDPLRFAETAPLVLYFFVQIPRRVLENEIVEPLACLTGRLRVRVQDMILSAALRSGWKPSVSESGAESCQYGDGEECPLWSHSMQAQWHVLAQRPRARPTFFGLLDDLGLPSQRGGASAAASGGGGTYETSSDSDGGELARAFPSSGGGDDDGSGIKRTKMSYYQRTFTHQATSCYARGRLHYRANNSLFCCSEKEGTKSVNPADMTAAAAAGGVDGGVQGASLVDPTRTRAVLSAHSDDSDSEEDADEHYTLQEETILRRYSAVERRFRIVSFLYHNHSAEDHFRHHPMNIRRTQLLHRLDEVVRLARQARMVLLTATPEDYRAQYVDEITREGLRRHRVLQEMHFFQETDRLERLKTREAQEAAEVWRQRKQAELLPTIAEWVAMKTYQDRVAAAASSAQEIDVPTEKDSLLPCSLASPEACLFRIMNINESTQLQAELRRLEDPNGEMCNRDAFATVAAAAQREG